jgi:tRNA(fMet)-specific endonuclease VapC
VVRHAADDLAICVITITEQLTGWQTALSKNKDEAHAEQLSIRMAQTIESLASWTVLHYPIAAMHRYADLKRQKLNVQANDLKIGAIALAFNAIVVTRNKQDFQRILGIQLENWAL